jgi:hypothetical protein
MLTADEQSFMSNVLKVKPTIITNEDGMAALVQNRIGNEMGMGMKFDFYNHHCEEHYAATRTDILQPASPAYCALQYADGNSAAVAYQGQDYRTFCMGFPIECIKDNKTRNSIVRGIMQFLLSK